MVTVRYSSKNNESCTLAKTFLKVSIKCDLHTEIIQNRPDMKGSTDNRHIHNSESFVPESLT